MGRIKAERLALWNEIIKKMQERDVFYVTEIAKDCGISYDKARSNIDLLASKGIVVLEKLPDRRKRLVKADEKIREYYWGGEYNNGNCDIFCSGKFSQKYGKDSNFKV